LGFALSILLSSWNQTKTNFVWILTFRVFFSQSFFFFSFNFNVSFLLWSFYIVLFITFKKIFFCLYLYSTRVCLLLLPPTHIKVTKEEKSVKPFLCISSLSTFIHTLNLNHYKVNTKDGAAQYIVRFWGSFQFFWEVPT
jgi:hypothetical protein